jgi:hypothetical protein
MKSNTIFGLMAVLLLVMFVTGGLWAQELKLDGYLNGGLGVVVNDSNKEGEDAYFKAFGVDGESNGYRFRLNGSYTNEAKNAGAKFRLQSQRNLTVSSPVTIKGTAEEGEDTGVNDHTHDINGSGSASNNTGYFSLPYAYGWVSFLDNKIILNGGIVNEGTWQTGDFWLASDVVGDGLGALLKVTPIKGLDLGFGTYVLNLQSSGNNNVFNIGGNLPNFANAVTKTGDAKYTYHAAYTMPGLLYVGASFRWKNKAGGNGTSIAKGYVYDGMDESSRLIGEIRYLGVKGLTAIAAASFDKIEDFDNAGNSILSETFGYKINDNINAGLNAVQFLYNRTDNDNKKVDMDPGLLFNLWGSYAINNIVPRLDLVYFMGGQSKMAKSDHQWERKGFANVMKSKDEDDKYSVFSIRPSVKFNLDGRTFLEIGDMINIDTAPKSKADQYVYADRDDAKKESLISNVFYIDVKVSF